MRKKKINAPCTILLAAVNVIVFIILTSQGMTEDGRFLLEHGAMYVPRVKEAGESYRLFTSMFLHFGFQHLMNNMVILVLVGWNLELEIGKIRFLLIYILSGLGAIYSRHGGKSSRQIMPSLRELRGQSSELSVRCYM